MLDAHAKAGIAEIVFYVPAVAAALYLLAWRHGRPRMAWILLLTFSSMRLAGGIISILLANDQGSPGLIIAALALLGTGVVPLVVATLGLLRIILATDFRDVAHLRYLVILCRALFLIGVVLLVAGASLEGQYKTPSTSGIGLKLVKAGYIIVLIISVYLLGFQAHFWLKRGQLSGGSITILQGAAAAIPFIVIRISYAFLSVFDSTSLYSKWSDLYGSVGGFVVMGLLMEYAVVLIYITVGFRIPPVGGNKEGVV